MYSLRPSGDIKQNRCKKDVVTETKNRYTRKERKTYLEIQVSKT